MNSYNIIEKNINATTKVLLAGVINRIASCRDTIKDIQGNIYLYLDHWISPKYWEMNIVVNYPDRINETDIHSCFDYLLDRWYQINEMSSERIKQLRGKLIEAGSYGLMQIAAGINFIWGALSHLERVFLKKVRAVYAWIEEVIIKLGKKIKAAFLAVYEAINKALSWIWNQILGWWDTAKSWIWEQLEVFGKWVTDKYNEVKDWVVEKYNNLKADILETWEDVKDWANLQIETAIERVVKTWDDLKAWFDRTIQPYLDKIYEKWEEFKDTVNEKYQEVKDWVFERLEESKDKIMELVDMLVDKVMSLNKSGINKVSTGIQTITRVAKAPEILAGKMLKGVIKKIDDYSAISSQLLYKLLTIK